MPAPYNIIAVVGLGYVGLPLAVAFGRRQTTIGYDLDEQKIEGFRQGRDPTREVGPDELEAATDLTFTADPKELARADCIVVAVPTPIDRVRRPDLGPLLGASETVGRHMARGTTVVFESTVYPGLTEEECVPVLERESGLSWKRDFHVAYAPERMNPGDPAHRLADIVKVVAGDEPETTERVAGLYGTVVEAGIHRAPSIKVAEAAKVIENTQRDLNISLMNELAIIFNKLDIDTQAVLEAAGTKWNFLPFRPGLVGGHCIGVDPYYLTYKAEMLGYHPQVILAGRRINDGMGEYIAEQTMKLLGACEGKRNTPRVGVLGLAFKENCRDLRNSRVIDLVRELEAYGVEVAVHDPWVDPDEARAEHGLGLSDWGDLEGSDALVLAVAHGEFKARPAQDYLKLVADGGAVVDVKSVLAPGPLEKAGVKVWRL